jgi:hypothetical protein
MPIAAKLSRTLYETLGREGAEAMVDWMQQVETQRSELRELNDLSFARIDARFGEARADLDLRFARVDTRLTELRAELDLRFARVDMRLTELRAELDLRFAHVDTRFATLEKTLVEHIERRFSDLIKWAFVFWVGSTVTLVVALAALARFAR